MTRKWFLGLLGIGAAGQQIQDAYPIYTIPKYTSPGGSNRPNPSNGECPVCGTMAPAYKRNMVPSQFNRNCRPIGDWGMECDKASYVPNGPSTRTVSCAHCRVRFDQDAEDVK